MSEENSFSDDGKIHDKQRLKELQALPLERKIQITQTRLIEWYTAWDGKCYVSFSGGKDSTVLADQASKVCKMLGYKLILWFSDTGLEYPEIKQHVKTYGEYLQTKYNIEVETVIDYPKDKNGKRIVFRTVLDKYGYPLVSKNISKKVHDARTAIKNNTAETSYAIRQFKGEQINPRNGEKSPYNSEQWAYLLDAPFKISHECCNVMKKKPAHKFDKERGLKPIIATMAEESVQRKNKWVKEGCNAFNNKNPSSKPLSFWTEQDILKYIKIYDIPIASVYGEIKQDENGKYYTTGCNRTGCVFCGFGCHLEKEPNRFQQLKETHPKLYEYCMKSWDEGGLGLDEVLNYINVKH